MTEPLLKSLREVAEIRNQEQALFDSINKQVNANSNDYPLDSWASDQSLNQNDVRTQYEDTFRLAAEELRAVSDCLDKVRAQLKRRRTDSNNLNNSIARPSQGGKSGAPSASSGTSKKSKILGSTVSDAWVHDPNNPLKPGLEVAALIEVDSVPQMWILAGIISYKNHPQRPRYIVLDLDPGEDLGPTVVKPPAKKYELDPKRIIPLPSFAEVPLTKRKEIPKGASVLALFPVGGVTTFYEAVVIAGPRKRKDDKYTVMFEDDGDQEREVSAQYVLPWPGEVGKSADD